MRPEARVLDALCAAYFPTIAMPEAVEPDEANEQLSLLLDG